MILPKLAFRNLLGGGLRTALNVIVLSFAFVTIVLAQGFIVGMYDQIARNSIDAEYGGGQIRHPEYDPYDPLTLSDAHGRPPDSVQRLIDGGLAAGVLMVQGTMYPGGRVVPIVLKGIAPEQSTIVLPTHVLRSTDGEIAGLIGQRMARNSGLRKGDFVTVQWRDVNGTYDAHEVRIAEVMISPAPSVDGGQIWVPLERLQEMTRMPGEITLAIMNADMATLPPSDGWTAADLDVLLADIRKIVEIRTVAASIFYLILLALGLLAIFDTQVLSVFRRRREIGTLMALGMTRRAVIRLFTIEGAFHGVLALLVGALWGGPLLRYLAVSGMPLHYKADDWGYAIGNVLYPAYGPVLIVSTVVIVMIATTIVSYLPTRGIAKLKPTDALRGRLA